MIEAPDGLLKTIERQMDDYSNLVERYQALVRQYQVQTAIFYTLGLMGWIAFIMSLLWRIAK